MTPETKEAKTIHEIASQQAEQLVNQLEKHPIQALIQAEKRAEELKKQHGTVYILSVPLDDEGKEYAIAFLKKPSRAMIGAALTLQSSDPLKANEIILHNCWIEGDERIRQDDEVFLGAVAALEELLVVRRGSLKKK